MLPEWVTHYPGIIQLHWFSPGSEGPAHTGVLRLEKPVLGRQPLECLALKVSGPYFQETQGAVGNRDSTLNSADSI